MVVSIYPRDNGVDMIRAIIRPDDRPAAGLTIGVADAKFGKSALRVTLNNGDEIAVELRDCFAPDRFRDVWESKDLERGERLIEIAKAKDQLRITIPMPTNSSRWWADLHEPTIKPAYLWLGDTTLNARLVAAGNRRAVPDYPSASHLRAPATIEHVPPPGLHCKIQAVIGLVSSARDTWRAMLCGDCECDVSLIDCYSLDPIKTARAVEAIIARLPSLWVTLPEPIVPGSWYRDLGPRMHKAGWVWLNQSRTLNEWLVERGLAVSKPVERLAHA